MTQRNLTKIIILAVTLLIAVNISFSAVHALGISPSIKIIPYHADVKYTDTFKAVNREDYPMSVRVRATGSLAEYVKFEQAEQVVPAKSSRHFKYYLTPPQGLEPGTHELRLHVEEHIAPDNFLAGGATGASALSAAAMILQVKSPFPERYAELRLQPINDINYGETAYIILDVSNYGNEILNNLQANIQISTADSAYNVKTTKAETLNILETQQLRAYWSSGSSPAGAYDVLATLDYGGAEPAISRSNFHIGDVFLSILGVVVKDLRSNGLAKFVINVKSEWSEPLDKVYAEVNVRDSEGNDLGLGQSKFDTVSPQATATLTAFWETPELSETEEYTAHIKVFYEDKVAEKEIKFTMASAQTGLDITTTIVIVLGVAVVLLALLMFLRKKPKKRQK